jgi:hypothetical protein
VGAGRASGLRARGGRQQHQEREARGATPPAPAHSVNLKPRVARNDRTAA